MCKRSLYAAWCVLGLGPAWAAFGADPALIGWWWFDDGAGTIVSDSSDYKNAGTLRNGPTWVPGKFGQALQFNGVDAYVQVPHQASLCVDTEVTVMAWINTTRWETPGQGWQGILSKGDSPCRSYSFYTESGGHLHFSVTNWTTGAYAGAVSNDTVPLHEWVHVCAMVKGGAQSFFINGAPAGTSGSGIKLPGTIDTSPVFIGRTAEGANRSFQGMIDDVRIYKRGLTADQVKEIYAGGGGFEPAPIFESGDLLLSMESEDIATWINGRNGGIATLLSDPEATNGTLARITTDGSPPWRDFSLNPAPPVGRYRLTLRARMASGQGRAIPVTIGSILGSRYVYSFTAMLDFSDVSPVAGFVVRSCDLLLPATTGGCYDEVWFADNMDVDWYMLESSPVGSYPPVEVMQAQTEKIFYKTNSTAVAKVRLLNTSSAVQVVHLRIRLESGLADSRVACDTSLAVPASGVPELFSFPVGTLAAGGTAVIAEILDDKQQVVSTARDYALSGDSPVDVSPLFANFIGQWSPYSPDGAALEMQPARLNCAALTELDFWAPCDTTMLTAPPGRTRWWSGQALKRLSVEQLQAYMQAAETQGIGVLAYADYSITTGWRILEAARQQPEILEWDVSIARGALFGFHMSPDGAGPLDSRQRREDDNEWASTSPDGSARVIMSSPAMLKLHADQLVASMKQFGWLGFRYDDPLAYDTDQVDIFGRQAPYGGWSNEAMIRYLRDRIAAQNPDAVYGRNADGMRAEDGSSYSDATGKTTQSATEAAILRGKGGFLLQEGFSTRMFLTKRAYKDIRDRFVTGGRNAKAGEGHIFAITDTWGAANDGEREYVGALAGAAGVQLAYQPGSTTPYMQFLARYSGLLFGKRVQPVEVPAALVKVDVGIRDVWWSNYVYCHYLGAGRRQYLVHLINPPVTTNVGDTVNSPEPVALTNVVVSFTLPAGWSATNATLLTPDAQAFVRSFVEPPEYPWGSGSAGYNVITEASTKTPTSQPVLLAGNSVTVPQVAKWSMVVLDCLGPANDLPDGPASTLPPLPTVPDVNLPPVAAPVTNDSAVVYCEPTSTGPNTADSPNPASSIMADPNARGGTALLIKTNMSDGEEIGVGFDNGLNRAGVYRFTVRVRTETDNVRDLYLRVVNFGDEPVFYRIDLPLGTTMLTKANGYREFVVTAHLGEATVRHNVFVNLYCLWPGLVVDYIRVEPVTIDTDSERLPLRGEVAWPGSRNVPDYLWRQAPRIWFANGLYHEYFRIKEALQAVAPGAQVSFGDPYLYGADNRGWNGTPFPGTPAELMQYHLVVLADVPANNNVWPTSDSTGLAWLDWLRGYVEKGGRVLLTGGPFGFGRGAWNSDLVAPMLPVTLVPRAITGLGYDLHPVSGGGAALQPAGPLADGLDWSTPAKVFWLHQATVRAGAVVQATADGLPAIVTGTYGAGRVAVVLAAPLGEPGAGQTAFWDAPQWRPLMSNVVNWLLAPAQ